MVQELDVDDEKKTGAEYDEREEIEEGRERLDEDK